MSMFSRRSFYVTSAVGVCFGLVGYAFKESFINAYIISAKIFSDLANFQVAGYYLPWKYLLTGCLLAFLFLYVKMRRRRAKTIVEPERNDIDNKEPVMVSGKTLLEIRTASQNIKELTRRLDSAEKTTHLIMRQMEAMTKCLAEVLREDKIKSMNNNNKSLDNSLETHL